MQAANGSIDEKRIGRRTYWPLLFYAVLLSGVVCSIVAWTLIDRFEERLSNARFEVESTERLLAIEEQLGETDAALEDLASLYAVSGDVTRAQFNRFVKPILARQTALTAVSWNPVVPHDQRSAHEAAARRDGLPDYEIRELGDQGELVRAPDREQYVVVELIEPIEGNERAIGFDVYSESRRRHALDQARDRGTFFVATPIELVQADGTSAGGLGFLPRYRAGAPIATTEQRRDAIVGYFVSVVDVSRTVDAALANLDPSDINVTISSVSAERGEELLYSAVPVDDAISEMTSATTLVWGGIELIVRFDAGDLYSSEFHTLLPLAALIGGLLLTFLLAGYFRSLHLRATRIEREVAERTRALQKANRSLETEVERRTAVESTLASYRDDLERQVGERTAELRYTTKQLRAIVDSEPECVKVITAAGELVEMNPAGLRMIEADSFDDVRGLCVYTLISDADRDAYIDLNDRVMAGQSATLEFELTGLRGAIRRVETHAVPLTTADGEPPLHLAITRDVTEARIAERERTALEAQLRHSQKLKSVGVLAGGIAHDFNNLLHIIVGNTELAMASLGDDQRSREALDPAIEAANEAAKLCDQLLTYAGDSRPTVRPVSLPRIVRSMVELLRISHTKKVRLEIELEDDLGAIDGDDGQLSQVVLNLVINAAEAIGEEVGSVTVGVRAVDVDDRVDGLWLDSAPPPDRYVMLEVADDGCGMSAEELDMIFDPFYTTKFAGRGLGLSSTLGIVRSHAGHLHVQSEVGVGTKFTALFPRSADTEVAAAAPTVCDNVSFEGTVLVVDDEEQIRSVLCALLEDIGLRVLTSANGEIALSVFDEHRAEIDLAILDVTMPKLNGNETCDALRANRADLPVIFCSGYAAEASLRSPQVEGPTWFLHKPYRRADLIAALSEADRVVGWTRGVSALSPVSRRQTP